MAERTDITARSSGACCATTSSSGRWSATSAARSTPPSSRRLQDQEGKDNIALQEECGIEVLTDGEVRRRFWFDPLTSSLSGYNPEVPAPVSCSTAPPTKPEREPPPKLPAVTEKLGIRHNMPLEEYKFVKRPTASGPTKATLAGMTYASVLWVPGYSDKVYPDREAYMDEVARADEERSLARRVEAGCDYFQLDSPRYTHLVSEEGQENLRNLGLDTETWLAGDDRATTTS